MTVGYSIVGEVSLNKTWKKEGSDVGETERKIFELVVGRDNEMAFKVKANADTRERKREKDREIQDAGLIAALTKWRPTTLKFPNRISLRPPSFSPLSSHANCTASTMPRAIDGSIREESNWFSRRNRDSEKGTLIAILFPIVSFPLFIRLYYLYLTL